MLMNFMKISKQYKKLNKLYYLLYNKKLKYHHFTYENYNNENGRFYINFVDNIWNMVVISYCIQTHELDYYGKAYYIEIKNYINNL